MKNYNGEKKYMPLSAWAYFGWSVLYLVPVIGWIFFLINTFRSDNINRRSFTRSYWCGFLVALIIGGALFGAGIALGGAEGIAEKITGSALNLLDKYSETEDSVQPEKVSPEFKAQMDAYEAFVDEYVAHTENMNPNNSDSLSEYYNYSVQLNDTLDKIEAIDAEQLSEADSLYYASTSLRIFQKLLKAEK